MTDQEQANLEDLQNSMLYHYQNPGLLQQALTHSSYANENPNLKVESNERLEFMGDAFLDFVFGIKLYHDFPDYTEGQMSRLRARLVCEASLAAAAETLQLGSFLFMGRGEDQNGGRQRPSILADGLEAIFGSVFLDTGYEEAGKVVLRVMEKQYHAALHGKTQTDYKTLLQEQLQQNGNVKIQYKVVESNGPDHAKNFRVEVYCNGKSFGTGRGHSKKEAEQNAAKAALDKDEPHVY